MRRSTISTLAAGTILAAALGAGALVLRDRAPTAWEILDYGPMDAAELQDEGFWFAPRILSVVYDAFARTDEAAIYDRLAEVAAGDALERLYLERRGAMVGGGLEPDQEIHEMEVLALTSRRSGDRIDMDARWRVLGTVGHAEHLHARGNAYAATLTVEPVDGRWRVTAFDLTDVDRTDAGTIAPGPGGPDQAAPPVRGNDGGGDGGGDGARAGGGALR